VTDDNFFLLSDGGIVTKQQVTFTNEDILSKKLLARVKFHIPVSFDLGSKGLCTKFMTNLFIIFQIMKF